MRHTLSTGSTTGSTVLWVRWGNDASFMGHILRQRFLRELKTKKRPGCVDGGSVFSIRRVSPLQSNDNDGIHHNGVHTIITREGRKALMHLCRKHTDCTVLVVERTKA